MNNQETDIYRIIGEMLRSERLKQGKTLEQAAEHLGVAIISVSRYECAERKIRMGMLQKYISYLGLSYDNFIKSARLKQSQKFFPELYDAACQNVRNEEHYILEDGITNEIIKKIKSLSKEEKEEVKEFINYLLSKK